MAPSLSRRLPPCGTNRLVIIFWLYTYYSQSHDVHPIKSIEHELGDLQRMGNWMQMLCVDFIHMPPFDRSFSSLGLVESAETEIANWSIWPLCIERYLLVK